METLAYLHLVLANEAQADMDYTTSTRESKNKGYRISTQSHFSTLAVVNLLPVAVTLLSIFGIAGHASALVQKGDQGTEVTAIQQRLKELGYFKGSATGYYGPVTKRAVTRFQQNKGLAADGIVGKNTSAALDLGEETEPSASVSEPSDIATTPITINRTLRLGDRSEQVSALQKRLTAAGFTGGEEGVFDQATKAAVVQFQKAKGLKVDGIVGPQTLEVLPEANTPKEAPTKAQEAPTKAQEAPTKPKEAPTKPKKPSSFFEKDAPLEPFIR